MSRLAHFRTVLILLCLVLTCLVSSAFWLIFYRHDNLSKAFSPCELLRDVSIMCLSRTPEGCPCRNTLGQRERGCLVVELQWQQSTEWYKRLLHGDGK